MDDDNETTEHFRTSSGFIESPNYPNKYDFETTKTYVILAPTDVRITLLFYFFELGNSSDCSGDYLNVSYI